MEIDKKTKNLQTDSFIYLKIEKLKLSNDI